MTWDWVNVAIQAGGAMGVCGMFLWFLLKKQKADDEARKEFLEQLILKDKATGAAIDKQIEYLKHRDTQAREVAEGGHAALAALAKEFRELRKVLSTRPKT